MNINWVVATTTELDPSIDLDRIKSIGSIWGSWRTWRGCQTDNVICHNAVRAKELIDKDFNKVCNFYIAKTVYVALGEPDHVHAYGGDFNHDVAEQDDLVAMHLAASASDIVLLLGFDWQAKPMPTDAQQKLLQHNYVNLVREAVIGNGKTQWVLVDHDGPIMPKLAGLENLTKDSLENIFGMLTN